MQELLKSQFQIVTRVYQTLLVGVLAYGLIAYWALRTDGAGGVGEAAHAVKYVLFFASMACVMVVPKFQAAFLAIKPEDDHSPEILVGKLYKMQMFCLGACEVPAFIGMVAAIWTKNMTTFFIFLAISYAGLYQYRPKWEQWERYFKQSRFI